MSIENNIPYCLRFHTLLLKKQMKLDYKPYTLQFKFSAGTSRGTLTEKRSVFIKTCSSVNPIIGEASFIPGLSLDRPEEVMNQLFVLNNSHSTPTQSDNLKEKLSPSLQFAKETLEMDTPKNKFSQGEDGILINGLIWMGTIDFMQAQIAKKIAKKFHVLKLKIGAINWETEYGLLQKIRDKYPKEILELRVDANGAFTFQQAQRVLDQLNKLDIHSIEQPIKKGQIEDMQRLCANTSTPIALDEELIGIQDYSHKKTLIESIRPQYLILKPGLLGGFKSCEEWIKIAHENGADFWVTSALESNVGLNAIAQWTYQLGLNMPQGLGTGELFHNNIPSPLELREDKLFYNPDNKWDYSALGW